MSQTEKSLQEGIQDVIQALSIFDYDDVTINDYTVMDRPGVDGPFFIIGNSDEWSSGQGTISEIDRWSITGELIYYIANLSWKDGQDGFRDARQAILDTFNAAGTARSAGGLEGVNIGEIRASAPVDYLYNYGVDLDLDPDATPVYMVQAMIFEAEVF